MLTFYHLNLLLKIYFDYVFSLTPTRFFLIEIGAYCSPYWLSNKMFMLMISLDIDKIKFPICFIATI